jgi:dihydrofolate reductase
MTISIIVAQSLNHVIGKNNQLPWHLADDLKFFKSMTLGHIVIMGRKTFESMGKILPQRTNVIITRSPSYTVDGGIVVHSLDEAISFAESQHQDMIFVIGGAEIFQQALPLASKLYMTEVQATIDGDTFFPTLNSAYWKEIKRDFFSANEKNDYDFFIIEFEKINS